MLETIIGLLFLGSIVFVATTGERRTDEKNEKDTPKTDEKDTPKEVPQETTNKSSETKQETAKPDTTSSGLKAPP
jgi:uncharacterized Zn finger protein (UPF0148 family)